MEEGTRKIPLGFTVNGKNRELRVAPRQTLLDVLRSELGLTGTKLGCDDGTCGTCVVTVNGAMARACRVPIEKMQGKQVMTIEGSFVRGAYNNEAYVAAKSPL